MVQLRSVLFTMKRRQAIICCVLAMVLSISFVYGAVHKIDVTVVRPPPLVVGRSTKTDVVYQGAVSNEYADVTFNIGRTSFTGTGEVGEEIVNPSNGTNLHRPPFPGGSRVNYPTANDSKKMDVILEGNFVYRRERFGAFYLKADDVKITTIIRNSEATIVPSRDTITVSIGDSVTLQVSTSDPHDELHWRHNNSLSITNWQGMTEVTINNVRKADDGIYECHGDGKRGNAEHAIMRLIVRACPNGKYGPECLSDCKTCYNGGVCEPSSGVCLCKPGFKGAQCQTACGNAAFGAECSIKCNSDGDCKDMRFCAPDPVGCSCIAGYTDEPEIKDKQCTTACIGTSYGADCELTCHCQESTCDSSRGCQSANDCDDEYGGLGCQKPKLCPDGIWGELCDRQCHCDTCNRDSGVCDGGECDEGWGDTDCQQALPSFYQFEPTVSNVTYTSLTIQWDSWNANVDYGTGEVEKYQVYFSKHGNTLKPYRNTTETVVDISGLEHETTYEFGVSIFRRINGIPYEGVIGPTMVSETLCGVPSHSPTITNTTTIGPYEIEVEWTIPDGNDWIKCSSGIYVFIIYDENGELKRIEEKLTSKVVITSLSPCAQYRLYMQVENKDHSSRESNVTTATTEPEKVRDISVTSMSSALAVHWTPLTQCSSIEYIVSYSPTYLDQCLIEHDPPTENLMAANASILIDDLQAYSTYEVAVSGITDNVQGEESLSTGITEEAVPSGTPSNITSTVNDTQLIYTWEQPKCGSRRGNITGYDYVFGLNIEDPEDGQVEYGSSDRDKRMIEFIELAYYKDYQFQVRANTSVGAGPYSSIITTTTPESYPEAPPQDIQAENRNTRGQLRFSWNPPPEDKRNGVITHYEYQFDIYSSEVDIMEWPINNWTTSMDVTFEDLPDDKQFQFRVRAFTSVGHGNFSNYVIGVTVAPSPTSSLPVGVTVGVSVSAALVLLLILPAVLFLKRRQKNKRRSSYRGELTTNRPTSTLSVSYKDNIAIVTNEESPPAKSPEETNAAKSPEQTNDDNALGETNEATDTDTLKPRALVTPVTPVASFAGDKPVLLEEFIEYVQTKRYNAPNHELASDFEALPVHQQGSVTISKKKENIKKNRYKNIITYDHSRVRLEPLEGDPNSDYINASYIDGFSKPRGFIATQGPNSESLKDFWRMVWQEKTRTIIMVTKCVEGPKKKCDKYWPDCKKVMEYGDISVTNHTKEKRAEYTIRTFTVINVQDGDDNQREVKQFHFTGWPDMQAPEFAGPVLELLEEANGYNPSDAGPVIVHCSAGVGRTGTFITIDSMLKMAKADGKVDIFNFVCQMRSRRVLMIQTEPQYEFIHDALLEALFCTGTLIANSDMERTWANISRDESWLVNQHRALEAMFPMIPVSRCQGAKNPDNLLKNRYPDRIPPDSARPYLMSMDDSGGNNYINATFCNGYKKENLYMATQFPLPNTVNDFWCMIFDYKCRTIVSLNDPERSDKSIGVYFLEKDALTCGGFTVECTSTTNIDNMVKRKLKLYKQNDKDNVYHVSHIQYTNWPDKREVSKSFHSFLMLLQHIGEARRESGDQRIAVMCMDGVSRCGVLCAIISIVDKIKEDQQVDVFQAVKRLRQSRYDMVYSIEQYKFCYAMAREYLQGFQTYANFAP